MAQRVSAAAAFPAAAPRRRAVRQAATRLLDGVADPEGRGLLLRGWEHRPLRVEYLPTEDDPLAVAARGLLRLARLAEGAAERLQGHPDAAVRRSAAVLAARAHPLRAGLEF